MGYVYKGTQRDVAPVITIVELPKVKPGPKPRRLVFTPEFCGTHYGYRLHGKFNVAACDPCMAANAASSRKYAARAKAKAGRIRSKEFEPSACGTLKGFHRHVRRGMEPCDLCRVAKNEYQNERRAIRKAALPMPAPRPATKIQQPAPAAPPFDGREGLRKAAEEARWHDAAKRASQAAA